MTIKERLGTIEERLKKIKRKIFIYDWVERLEQEADDEEISEHKD